MFQAARGTTDLLPQDLANYRFLEQKAQRLADQYGFEEIRTPVFEKADLFVRGLGVMAGIVERELWTFHDKHGQKLALRADMTPCVVRAYQQHKLGNNRSQPVKLSYVGPVFLVGKEGDQPSRQSQQFGVEVLGNDSPALDAELLCMALDYCQSIGLTDVRLEMNSLGCEKCRPAYFDALREFFAARQNELCQTCRRKYRNHPTWVLSCPEAGCQSLANLAPTILGYLCQDCKTHFNALKHLIQELDLDVAFNLRVVRDLEYYTRTVFRLECGGRTIGVGGRYDGLVEQLGGADTPAAGFAIYLDEVQALMEQPESVREELDFVFLPEGAESIKVLLPIALKLRRGGARVEIAYNKPDTPLEARWLIRLSEVHALRGQVEISDQDTRQQEKCSADRLLVRLQHLLGQGQRDSEGEGRGQRRRLSRVRKEREPRRNQAEAVAIAAPWDEASRGQEEVEEVAAVEEDSRRRKRHRRRREEEDTTSTSERASAPERESSQRETREPREPREPREVREPRESRGGRERGQQSPPERRPEPAPMKAFIPSLVLGSGPAEPTPVATKVVAAPKATLPLAGLEMGGPAPSSGLNWSIKGKVNGSASEDQDTPSEVPVRTAARHAGRRPSRRR
jgi:histidyl-tRNA synthetase